MVQKLEGNRNIHINKTIRNYEQNRYKLLYRIEEEIHSEKELLIYQL